MNAQRKLQQAKYHLEEMKKYSGKQDEYMFNLVSFIQSAREITWYLQKEFKNDPKFDNWYKARQEEMRGDDILRFFKEKRNVVVKQSYPDLKGFTGEVTFYYINAQGKMVSGSCWADPSMQPTVITVPGGTITINPSGAVIDSNTAGVLKKCEYETHYFFEDCPGMSIPKLCKEYIDKLENLCYEWQQVMT